MSSYKGVWRSTGSYLLRRSKFEARPDVAATRAADWSIYVHPSWKESILTMSARGNPAEAPAATFFFRCRRTVLFWNAFAGVNRANFQVSENPKNSARKSMQLPSPPGFAFQPLRAGTAREVPPPEGHLHGAAQPAPREGARPGPVRARSGPHGHRTTTVCLGFV